MSLWRKWKERPRPLSDAREIRKFHGNPNSWARTNHPFGNCLYHLCIAGWWFRTFFFHILGIIIPTDELIFFRGVETTNQMVIWGMVIMIYYDCFTHITAYHGIKSKSKPVQTGLDTFWIFGDLSNVALPEGGKQRCSLGPPFAASTLSFSGSRSHYISFSGCRSCSMFFKIVSSS